MFGDRQVEAILRQLPALLERVKLLLLVRQPGRAALGKLRQLALARLVLGVEPLKLGLRAGVVALRAADRLPQLRQPTRRLVDAALQPRDALRLRRHRNRRTHQVRRRGLARGSGDRSRRHPARQQQRRDHCPDSQPDSAHAAPFRPGARHFDRRARRKKRIVAAIAAVRPDHARRARACN
ncbi:MAG: hypothetical protein U1A27_14635 [Phycisphaerae bacterium]